MAKFLTAADFQDSTTTQDSRFVTADFFSDEAIAKRNSAQADLDEPKNMLSYKAQVSALTRQAEAYDKYQRDLTQYYAQQFVKLPTLPRGVTPTAPVPMSQDKTAQELNKILPPSATLGAVTGIEPKTDEKNESGVLPSPEAVLLSDKSGDTSGGYSPQFTPLDNIKAYQNTRENDARTPEQIALEAKMTVASTGITSDMALNPNKYIEAFDVYDRALKAFDTKKTLDSGDYETAEKLSDKLLAEMGSYKKYSSEWTIAKYYYDKISEYKKGSYLEYAADYIAAGLKSVPEDIGSAFILGLGNIVTGGQMSDDYKKLNEYFKNRSSELIEMGFMPHTPGYSNRLSAVAKETGVSVGALKSFLDSMGVEALIANTENTAGRNLDEANKKLLGSLAYTLGQQIPGFLLTVGVSSAASGGSGLIGRLMNGEKLSGALLSAAKIDNAFTVMMGAVSASNKYLTLAKEGGYRQENLYNALATGYIEAFTENLFGFTDANSIRAIFSGASGSTVRQALINSSKWLLAAFEEGFEEAAAVPLEGMIDKLMLEPEKEWFGRGGVFDLETMLENGINGAIAGGVLGGIGMTASITAQRADGKIDNRAAVVMLNAVARDLPEGFRPELLDANANHTAEEIDRFTAKIAFAFEAYTEYFGEQANESDTSVAPTQPEAPAVTAKPTTAQGITQTLKSTGEISAAQIDTIVKSPENRAVFTQETGVELPAAVGDARRAIRAYQADINSEQANTAVQPSTINADATSPQTGVVVAPPAQAAVVEPVNAIYGKEGKTYTKDNDAINFTYAVVDVNDLITSNDVYGNVNPNYPVELQPRDRTRVASQAQVQEMAKKLNPELLGASPTAQNGAPIIGADGVVEGGNGRVNAIALAYQTNGAKNYKQYIIDNAAEYGVDVSRLPAKPVLVRVNASTESRADVAKKLNQSTISTYSSTESALTDASKIGTILDDFVPNDDGTINTADNKKFISRFINEVAPASERNSLVTSDGWLSQAGLERVKNAIFAAVYNDAGLLARLSENLDDNSKNVIRALLNTASNALSIKSRIDNGVLYDIDLSGDVLQAARLYEQLKRSKTEIEDYFAQSALLDDGYSDEAKVLAWFFSKHKRGARAMSEFINTIYQTVEDLGSPNQITLGDESFGADETKASVLESAIRSYERENGETLSIPEFQRKDSSISATETAKHTATVAKASPKQKQTISGYHTPVKVGLEKIANTQSAGLPSGYFIALDKPFESSAHNADKAFNVDADVNNVYDPNGLLGKATPDYTSEMVDYASKNSTASGMEIISQTRDLMRDFLLSKGYDAYVRAIDGQRNNRELIIFDKNNVKENKSTTKKTQTATAVMERPTQADTDTDAEIAENKVGEGDVWQTTRIGTDEDVKSLTQIVKQAYTDLDIPIIRGGIKGRRSVQGQYRTGAQTIHIRTNNDILTIAHEVGHHLDTQHRLVSTASPEARQELLNNLSPGMAAAYKANQLPAEGVAEFFRYYFTNADEARAAYPEFSAHVDNKLPQKTLDVINRLAQSMNTYLSAPVYEQYLSAVSMSTDNAPTLAEKWQGVKDKFTEYFIDDLAGLKRFGDAVENTRSYILAQNSRYASGTVDALLKTELRDMNGKYVGESLLKAVEDINVKDAAELRAFNLYLILKHAPERIGDMKKVFANPELESQANIDASVAKLEAQYPSFASAADRVYQFQKNLLKAYGVDSGLISQKVADEWDKKYPHYIPLQRDLSNTKKKSAKNATSKVNQSLSPFKAAKGSGLDILAPLEGIVWNTNRMVLAAKSNAVRIATTEAAATTVGAGKFLEREKIPTELKKFNAIELKKNTIEALKNSTSVDENVLKNVIDSVIEDTLEQYTRSSKIQDNIMLVMKNGEPQYWRVNDTMLLHSLENVGTQTVKGFWDAYGKVTRVITQAATGGNVVWSIFSNALRDIQTGAIYDRSGNTGKWLLNIGKAYYQQVTDKAAREKGLTPSRMSEYYREYLSLGGANNISRISADRADTAKSFSGLLSKKQYLNPLDAIASVSDVIEQAPRFAEYASLREKGVQAGNAFYQAMDVTVNFRRGGTWSRQINKAIPFYNASIQGLDKMFRNFTAADVPVSSRKKIMTRRFAKHAALSAIVAFAQIVPKLFDEDEKKDYEQLSAYQKNGAYNIYLGDGKFFSIKKTRELGILTSFFERTMEYALLTNKDAYYEFASYASEQLLPPLLDVLPLVASGDMDAVGGSLASTFGAAGSLFALTLNVDYRGNPIVSEALGRLHPKFQYDESTSFLAKTLGGMLNLSPKKIDYALNTWLGMYQTVNKSLFPVGGAERDWTLGVANTYVKDNQYSQDIVNKFYTSKTTTDKNSASYPDKSAYKIQSKDYGSMAQFYSNTVKIAQNTDMTTPLNRAARQTVLEMLEQFSTEIDSGNASPTKQSMDKLAAETGDTSFYPQTMGVVFTYTPNKGNRIEIALTYTQYLQYQTAYNAYYYNKVGKVLNKSYKNADDKMSAVQRAKREAKEKIDKEMFSLLTGRK